MFGEKKYMWGNCIRLLQIGDVHYPDTSSNISDIDIKDNSVSDSLLGAISEPPLQSVMRALGEILQNQNLHSILFMGDLTTRGDLQGFKDCLEYIGSYFEPLLDDNPHLKSSVIVVPGNHDIDRQMEDDTNILAKFETLTEAIEDSIISHFPVDDISKIDFSETETGSLKVFGLNSCLGCGSKQYLPERIREVIADKLKSDSKNASQAELSKLLDDLYEVLDTPAFSRKTLSEIENITRNTLSNNINLFCAHHNILPQAQPRIAPYTELINSGAARQALSIGKAPAIYLHGHIHDDPIDILSAEHNNSSSLVVISAPEMADGFNLIEIYYDNEQRPLGLLVRKFRRMGRNAVSEINIVKIPFYRKTVLSQHASKILKELPPTETLYWRDLLDQGHTDENLATAISELWWRDEIEIINIEDQRTSWVLRKLNQ